MTPPSTDLVMRVQQLKQVQKARLGAANLAHDHSPHGYPDRYHRIFYEDTCRADGGKIIKPHIEY